MNIIKLNFLLVCCLSTYMNAQVALGKSSVDGAGILDFAPDDTRGIILPYTNKINNPVNGTFTFDLNTNKVLVFSNNSWLDLTSSGTAPNIINTDPDLGGGVIIGAESSVAKGVLVLESNSKALILPKVNNVSLDIYLPSPGTMCYDLTEDAIAVFNGVNWSFWK